jgi:LPXTG-motif cell wall-anchored protein
MCCVAGETSYCAECCADSDCGDCEICDSGVCAPVTDCCKGAGASCSFLEVTDVDSAAQLECCDGLVCCYGLSNNVCAQCCIDENCDAGGTCEDGVCVYPILCIDDKGCPEHTCCCDDGSCSWHCCDHHHHHPHPHPKPPKPTPEAPVTTLPATGSGKENTSSGLLGAAALGAAALFAAKRVRDQQAIEPGSSAIEK